MLAFLSRLPVLEKFIRYWVIFYRYTGASLLVYILISLLVTLVESVGISLFFPLLSGLQGGGNAPSSAVGAWVARAFSLAGIEYGLGPLLGLMVVVFLLKAAIQFGAGAYQSHIIARFLREITMLSYGSITSQDYRSFLSRNIGVLANMTVNETNRAMTALVKFAGLFPSMIAIGIFAFMACRIDLGLTVAALVFGFFVLLLTRYVAKVAKAYSYRNTEAFGRLNELVLQSFGAFKYLRSTAGMEPLRRQVGKTVDRLSSTQFALSTTANFSQVINEPVIMLFLVGMLWHQTMVEKNSLAQVVVLALFFFRLIKEVMLFQTCWHGFNATLGSIDFVSSVIRDAEASREIFSGRKFGGLERGVRFEGVSFSYGNRQVLHGVTLEVPRNAMVAVVGESGSGKSTFVDLLTGMLRPSEGTVLLDGRSLQELDLSSYRARMGYVTQEPALFNDTIANNISFWAEGDPIALRSRVEAAASAANCRAFIEELELGFDTVLGDRGVNLSGGQRQRVAIARELFKRPDLLILDEATSALDSETELEVQKSIEGLRGQVTTVVIAHRLSTIRRADLIYVFSEGRVAEVGTFDELHGKAGSLFRKICELQGLR